MDVSANACNLPSTELRLHLVPPSNLCIGHMWYVNTSYVKLLLFMFFVASPMTYHFNLGQ